MVNSSQLPIIDLSGLAQDSQLVAITNAVRKALSDTGFMYVTGHGIDAGSLKRTFAAAENFFATSTANKQRFAYTDITSNFGFQGIEAESLDPANLPDLKEAFTMRNAMAAAAAQRWPDPVFQETALNFYSAGVATAYRILAVLAAALELPTDFFTQRHRGENITLRLLHYPANLHSKEQRQLGAGEHTDYGSITLLWQDAIGGLEVRDRNGQWQAAPHIENSLLVNTGDLMERWTNGLFRSTLHRVRPITGAADRYSIALFIDPDTEVNVECIRSCIDADHPARYPPITAGEHIRQKIAATHSAPPAETRP